MRIKYSIEMGFGLYDGFPCGYWKFSTSMGKPVYKPKLI